MALTVGKRSLEKLTHFNCGQCGKWWSIGDSPADKEIWFCPWCGCKQRIVDIEPPNEVKPTTPSSQ